MLELIEIQGIARQGMTKPLICRGSDGKLYYAKGKAATASGLIKEWMAANLAQSLGLPIPNFYIAYIDSRLIDYSDIPTDSLGAGEVFVSEQVTATTELQYSLLASVPTALQREILLFDLWIENEDRTLTEHGGNPNLLCQSTTNPLFIIDHNLAFGNEFNLKLFWETHAFQVQFSHYQFNLIDKQNFEAKLKHTLKNWQQWWDAIPDDWKQDSHDFDPNSTLKRLQDEASGDLWRKFR